MNYEISFFNDRLTIHKDGQVAYQKSLSDVPPRERYNSKALAIEAALVMHTDIQPELCEDIALRLLDKGWFCLSR